MTRVQDGAKQQGNKCWRWCTSNCWLRKAVRKLIVIWNGEWMSFVQRDKVSGWLRTWKHKTQKQLQSWDASSCSCVVYVWFIVWVWMCQCAWWKWVCISLCCFVYNCVCNCGRVHLCKLCNCTFVQTAGLKIGLHWFSVHLKSDILGLCFWMCPFAFALHILCSVPLLAQPLAFPDGAKLWIAFALAKIEPLYCLCRIPDAHPRMNNKWRLVNRFPHTCCSFSDAILGWLLVHLQWWHCGWPLVFWSLLLCL